jgi:hypothetical protein
MPTAPESPNYYIVLKNLNLYDSPKLEQLATQAEAGRLLRFLDSEFSLTEPIQVRLYEDDYPGWLAPADRGMLEPMTVLPPEPLEITPAEIQASIPTVIHFCQHAMRQPNFYLWGGTYGPNYDCSGLMQHSFASMGIQLPRDAYQQEAFCQPVAPGKAVEDVIPHLLPGDLIFFGTPAKATHVGIYLGDGQYLHSSGQAQGRNGIGIDHLSPTGDPVTMAYLAQFRGAGRVVCSYKPQTWLG